MDKTAMISSLINTITHGNKTQFANMLGITPQAVNTWITRGTFNAELIYEKIPNISAKWLLSGKGNMLNDEKTQPQLCNLCNTQETLREGVGVEYGDVESLPVIPCEIYKAPDVDIYKYVRQNTTDTLPTVSMFPVADMYYRVMSRSMEPYFCSGDILALKAYPIDDARVLPGSPYVVDTRPNGMILRLLYPHPDGYSVHAYHDDRYTDFIIPTADIIRIYRIVGLLRIDVQ